MPSLLDLPTELIIGISEYLPRTSAIDFSRVNSKIHGILKDTRLAPEFDFSTLLTAIAKGRDATAIT
jgi:hypothetical protein